jgi:hypothetical protein
MTARVSDWEARLADAVAAAAARPFAWGVHDCLTWVAEVRCALTGADGAQAWRGSYHTRFGAMRALHLRGFETLEAAISSVLGPPLTGVLLAMRGDVVTLRGDRFDAAGICIGADAVFVAEAGLLPVPLDRCALAWRV